MYCCSQCNFSANFESALIMHRQLHHEPSMDWNFKPTSPMDKFNTVPRTSCERSFPSQDKGIKLGRASSATRLFEKLRARLCRSKTLFSHPEEDNQFNDTSGQSECTSKALKDLGSAASAERVIDSMGDHKESYGCHLCSFDTDRITVLDRHLLNDHKIGLETLLKLVMAKTKDGLAEENPQQIYGLRQPYYKQTDEIIDNGEFVIETVTPKIKFLKHTASNTDLKWTDIPDVKNNLSRILDPDNDKDALLSKIEVLNECMCKFVDSSNTLKKVLTKEFDHKTNDGGCHDLGLGDQDSPRDWERAHSETLERNRSKRPENRSEKLKYPSESFYF